MLAVHLLALINDELNTHVTGIESDALAMLQSHAWAGNVRELEHTLKRAVLMAHGALLTIHDLEIETTTEQALTEQDEITSALQQAARTALRRCLESGADGEKNLFHRLVSITEQTLVDEALKLCNGNQVAAAELLSVHRTTLRNKLNK